MTTQLHTPGPWEQATNERIKGTGWMWIIDSTGALVAKVNTIHQNGQREAHDFAQESANAHLIASAPDLLAALENCLQWLENMRYEVPEVMMNAQPEHFGLNQAHTAIKRAKGE